MHLVLDSNEYIFAYGIIQQTSSAALITHLLSNPTRNKIYICRTIVNEVQRNISFPYLEKFYDFIHGICILEEDYVVPFELGAKYEKQGLKPGDAFIAAYAEHVKAELLVSENRHFLSRRHDLLFRVVNAAECLRELKSGN